MVEGPKCHKSRHRLFEEEGGGGGVGCETMTGMLAKEAVDDESDAAPDAVKGGRGKEGSIFSPPRLTSSFGSSFPSPPRQTAIWDHSFLQILLIR